MKNVFRHQNAKKDKGFADTTITLFLMLFVAVLTISFVKIYAFMSTAQGLEDAIVDAALSSAVPDLSEYGRSGSLSLYPAGNSQAASAQTLKAWQMFVLTFRTELKLDTNMIPENRELYGEIITINDFRIYNIIENTIYVWQRSGNGMILTTTATVGTLNAPDGSPIIETSIYADISTEIGGRYPANKKKLVAIKDR